MGTSIKSDTGVSASEIGTVAGNGETSVSSDIIPDLNTTEMDMNFATGGKSLLSRDNIKLNANGLGLRPNGNMFSSDNIGGTMQGIGSIATAAASVYDAYNKKKYQDKVFGMEEKRVERETARQDKQQAAYDKVFG